MTITVRLSEAGVRKAIQRLRQAQDNLRWGVQESVDELVKDGALIANDKYGGMAFAVGYSIEEHTGIVSSVGEANLIAEFGAGDATLPPACMFENVPDTPVYPGSYSESEEGTGEYAATGKWHFGGREYRKVDPRMGLYNARNYIEKNAVAVVKEVVKL